MDEENQINLQNVDIFAPNLKKGRIGYYGLSTDPTKITNLSSDQISTALKNKISPTMSNSSLSLQDFASSYEKANIIGGAVSGLGGILSGLVGGRARRREQRQAKEQYDQMMADYKNFQFENAYLNVENPFEDLRVSTEAAEFQAQQQQQGLAQTLDALRAGGGGVGAAALAQSLANVQAQQTQNIAADIARQETINEQLAAGAEYRRQTEIAKAGMEIQGEEFERTETMLGLAQQRKAAADAARQQATASLLGGISSLAGAVKGAVGLPGGIGSLFRGGN